MSLIIGVYESIKETDMLLGSAVGREEVESGEGGG